LVHPDRIGAGCYNYAFHPGLQGAEKRTHLLAAGDFETIDGDNQIVHPKTGSISESPRIHTADHQPRHCLIDNAKSEGFSGLATHKLRIDVQGLG
jgi:hypothetical protein